MANEMTLSELIAAAAGELRKAQKATGTDPVMQFTGCEIEMGVKASKQGGAGIQIYVLNIGGKVSKEQTSTIKLTFGPVAGKGVAYMALTDMTVSNPKTRRKGTGNKRQPSSATRSTDGE